MCSVVKIFVLIEVLGRLPITLIVSVICQWFICVVSCLFHVKPNVAASHFGQFPVL